MTALLGLNGSHYDEMSLHYAMDIWNFKWSAEALSFHESRCEAVIEAAAEHILTPRLRPRKLGTAKQ